MFLPSVLALFLYFPEDKREYIPAAITCVIFLIGALLTMRLIIKISNKEALKTKELEEQVNKNHTTQRNS